jgi:hypothetical protein
LFRTRLRAWPITKIQAIACDNYLPPPQRLKAGLVIMLLIVPVVLGRSGNIMVGQVIPISFYILKFLSWLLY